MKLVKTASGKKQIKISKKEWESIGKKAGWFGKEPGMQMGGYGDPILDLDMFIRGQMPELDIQKTDKGVSFDAAILYQEDRAGATQKIGRLLEVIRKKFPTTQIDTTGTAYQIYFRG